MLIRRYKGKDHGYFRYVLEIPARMNVKVEPYLGKDFDVIEIIVERTPTHEVLNISLIRHKPKE